MSSSFSIFSMMPPAQLPPLPPQAAADSPMREPPETRVSERLSVAIL
jgi:hypothetical protein